MSHNTEKHVKIGIRDDDGDIETPWAVELGDDRYRLDNTPFFAYRLSWGDVVEALPEADGSLFFTRVLEKSGHRTIRVLLAESVENAAGQLVVAEIARLGCTYEGATSKLICIDIPPSVSLEVVAARLTELDLEWEYADSAYSDLFPDDDDAAQ